MKFSVTGILSGIMTLVSSYSVSFAQSVSGDSTSTPINDMYSPSLFGILVKLVISLVLIIGLIYLSTYFMKKLNTRAAGGGNVGDTIKIVGRTFLSPKQSLFLVKIGQRYTVLGVSDQNINAITELTKEEASGFETSNPSSVDSDQRGKFSEMFKGILRR